MIVDKFHYLVKRLDSDTSKKFKCRGAGSLKYL